MKKFFAFGLIALLFAMVQFVVPPQTVPTNRDVGYSLTIDQNIPQTVFLAPAVADYQISRGVSVPYKGLTNDVLTFSDELSFECNLYYTIEKIDSKLPTLAGFESQPDKYPFVSDLGNRKS